MSDLSQVTVFSESSDIHKNVFCNPVFEFEGEREERLEEFRTSSSTPEPVKPAAATGLGWGFPVMRLRGSGSDRSLMVITFIALLLLAAFGVTLALLLSQLTGQTLDGQPSNTPIPAHPASQFPFTVSTNRSRLNTTVAPPPTRIPSETNCGGVMTYSEGTLSSPNHPGSYPPNALCMWVIRVPPPAKVQIHVSSLGVEGPSPCLFDWLEVQEQNQLSQQSRLAVATRFCGNVSPPTINTNSSTVWVVFHSDGSIAGTGFTAQYRAVQPGQESCFKDEFKCDRGRCLLSVSVCDGQPNCQDQSDEADCSHKRKECGGVRTGPSGYVESPNHPEPYPHQQLCIWQITVADGDVITLSFTNFSLETQDVCEFDYVEVHDSPSTGVGRVLGRFCGSAVPPELTSSGPHMTLVFVADEGVADFGFNASYRAVSVRGRSCGPDQFPCSTGECLNQQWLCDGWNDCPDGADERECGNSTFPPFVSLCELIEVEMCRGLSYNLTSFPNIWLSIADQREADTLLQQYQVLMELACFEPLQRLLCGMFLPQCSPHGGVLQPCRAVCTSAEQQCSQALDLFSFSWPFNCHLLPDSQDPMDCSLP